MAYSFDETYWQQRGVFLENNEKLLSVACYHEKPTVFQNLTQWGSASGNTYFVLLTNKQAVLVPYGEPEERPVLFVNYKDIKVSYMDNGLKINLRDGTLMRIYPDLQANSKHNVDSGRFLNVLGAKGKNIN